MQVLVVDDDRTTLSTLRSTLGVYGHEVATAHSGREALESVRAGGPRLLVCDWEMPEMSGIELCRALRQEDLPGYVYLILLTGRRKTHQDLVEGLSAGADDFMTKPYSPAELHTRLKVGERILGLETRDVAVFAMAKLAESRDPESGMHLERIRNYSRTLAQRLLQQGTLTGEITPEFVRMIYLTSPLHDIGKVGIPDRVLLKAGRLHDDEFTIMKTHTSIGAATLQSAADQHPEAAYLRMAHDIALTHHERFDGAGYPSGLAKHEIPLCGRIVGLADVYDALTSTRMYKEQMAHTVARNIIIAESDAHFDPDVVEAFIQSEDDFQAIRQRFT